MTGKLIFDHLMCDMHVHFRNPGSPIFDAVVPFTAASAGCAVIMPNIVPFVTTAKMAKDYEAAVKERMHPKFVPIMTGYLTEDMTPQDIDGFCNAGFRAMKAYPRGATTNSHGGIADFRKCHPALSQMEARDMRLLLHPEHNYDEVLREEVDPYDREKRYLDSVLIWLQITYPRLRICVEHVTSKVMGEHIARHGGDRLACTVTAHHLHISRKDFFRNGPDVHLHCWPIAKREEDMWYLQKLVTSGYSFVFAGTDSAPHPTHAKEKACGCAGGVFTAHAWYSMYLEIMELEEASYDHIQKFLCLNGPAFYGIPPIKGRVVLEQTDWRMEEMIKVSDGSKIFPFGYHPDPAEQRVFNWRLVESVYA